MRPPERPKSTAADPARRRFSQSALAQRALDGGAGYGKGRRMRNHKSSRPQTFGEIISMIEDALASYHCAPTGDGAVPLSISGAGHGAGQVPFLDDAGRERYGNPPDAAAASGAYMHRHITDEGRSSETARTPDIGTAHGFDETVSRLLDLLRRTGSLPEAGITIAVDTHLVPSHGHAFGPGAPCRGGGRGADPFERYVTVQRVDAGPRLFLGALPLLASEPVGGRVGDLVRSCQDKGVRIRMVLLDRGFFTVDVVSALDSLRVNYLMPCGSTPEMARTINGLAADRRGRASGNGVNGTDGVPAGHTLIMAQPPAGPGDEGAVFATNVPGADAGEYYSKWGVEAGHAVVEGVMNEIGGDTEPGLVSFLRSLMVFNGWVMIDTLQSHRPRTSQGGHPETAHAAPESQLPSAVHQGSHRPSDRSWVPQSHVQGSAAADARISERPRTAGDGS